MTVRELIDALGEMDQDATVWRETGKHDDHLADVMGASVAWVNGDGWWWPEGNEDEDDPIDDDAILAVRLW